MAKGYKKEELSDFSVEWFVKKEKGLGRHTIKVQLVAMIFLIAKFFVGIVIVKLFKPIRYW